MILLSDRRRLRLKSVKIFPQQEPTPRRDPTFDTKPVGTWKSHGRSIFLSVFLLTCLLAHRVTFSPPNLSHPLFHLHIFRT